MREIVKKLRREETLTIEDLPREGYRSFKRILFELEEDLDPLTLYRDKYLITRKQDPTGRTKEVRFFVWGVYDLVRFVKLSPPLLTKKDAIDLIFYPQEIDERHRLERDEIPKTHFIPPSANLLD